MKMMTDWRNKDATRVERRTGERRRDVRLKKKQPRQKDAMERRDFAHPKGLDVLGSGTPEAEGNGVALSWLLLGRLAIE